MTSTSNFKTLVLAASLLSVMLVFSGTEAGILSSLIGVNTTTQSSVFTDFVSTVNISSWNSIKDSDLKLLSKSQLQALLNAAVQRGQTIPTRIQMEIKRRLLTSMSSEEIRTALSDAQVTPSTLQQLRRALPPPESLNADNITFYGPNILKFNKGFILGITNTTALQAVYQMASQKCYSTNDNNEKENCKSFLNHLLTKINGQPETWTLDTVNRLDLSMLTANTVSRIPASVIVSDENAFTQILGGSNDASLRRILVKKILTGSNFYNVQSNTSAALLIINQLGSLKSDLLPEDITYPVLQQIPEVSSALTQNVQIMARTGKLTPKSAASLQNTLRKAGNITAALQSTYGINVVGFAFPNAIRMAAQNGLVRASDVVQIVSGLQQGVGKPAKLQALTDIVNATLDPFNPSVSQYPNECINELPQTTIRKLSEGDAKTILSRDGNKPMEENTRRILLNKVNSGYTLLTSQARSLLSNSKVRGMQSFDILQVATNLPPASTVAMIAAEKAFPRGSQIDVSVIMQSLPAAQFMGAKEALMVNVTNIVDVLVQMADSNPSMAACMVLKNKYYNFTRDFWGSTSEENTVRQMTITDIGSMPVGVFAAFGTNAIDYLTDDGKAVLLMRLGLVKNPDWSIPRPFIMKAIKNGLPCLRPGTRLLSGDVEVIGNALYDVPGSLLSTAVTDVYIDVITKLNSLIIKRQILPCLDPTQRNEIGKMIKNIKGDPSTWDTVNDVVCLLGCMQYEDLNNIPGPVITANSCSLGGAIPILNETLMSLCKSSLGLSDFNTWMAAQATVQDIQIKAALNMVVTTSSSRKKRQTSSDTSTICAKASYGGGNAFSDPELANISCSTIMSCLSDFGSMDMAQSKATILATTLKNCYMSSFNASDLVSMAYILKGFSASDYSSLPKFTYGSYYDNVVALLGTIVPVFSPYQVQQLASKIKLDWRTPYSMSPQDLQTVNHLLCGFSASDINLMNSDAVHDAMGTISCMDDCPMNPVIYTFSNFAKTIYGSNVTNWTKADITELCVFIDGLAPEDIIKIDPPAMEGLTPAAMEKMPLDLVKALLTEQIIYFNAATAQAVTPLQISVMTPGMQRALQTSTAAFVYVDNSATANFFHDLSKLLIPFSVMLFRLHFQEL